jgi:hypothetical protein
MTVKVTRNDDNVTLYDSNGKSYTTDYAVCTVPLRIMKSGLIKSIPPLSMEKEDLVHLLPVGGVFDEIVVGLRKIVSRVTENNILIFYYFNERYKKYCEILKRKVKGST